MNTTQMKQQMQPITEDSAKLDQLATYIAHGIGHAQAGASVGFSAGRVSQLMAQEDFQQLVSEKSAELASEFMDINTKYNKIELMALNNIVDQLRFDKSTDLAVRLATMANRAVRRGGHGNAQQPLRPVDNDGKIVIQLNMGFIDRMQAGHVTVEQAEQSIGNTDIRQTATQVQVNKLLAGKLSFGVRDVTDVVDQNAPQDDADNIVIGGGLLGIYQPID